MAIPTDFDISSALENFENHQLGLYPRSERYNFFNTMFDNVDWHNAVILDLGGNRGNLLEDLQQQKIGKEENYYCLDVDHEALNFGKSNYPNANCLLAELQKIFFFSYRLLSYFNITKFIIYFCNFSNSF